MFSSNDSDGDYCRTQRAGLLLLLLLLLLLPLLLLPLLLLFPPVSSSCFLSGCVFLFGSGYVFSSVTSQ
jgi:hypothetical protein